jgi:hypothetical protein
MIISIMQPAYLPWLGFFERIMLSDVFVVLDNVQLDTNSKTNFTTRNKIRTPQGFSLLTVPIKKKGNYGNLFINQLEISNETNWKQKHWDTVKQFYKKAPFFKEHALFFETVFAKDQTLLIGLMNEIMQYLIDALGIRRKIIYASALGIQSTKDDLIIDICHELKATRYISGPFGRDYLNRDAFKKWNMELLFHDYQHPEYKQLFPGFYPYMSVIDLLFNYGPGSLDILNTTKHADQLSK